MYPDDVPGAPSPTPSAAEDQTSHTDDTHGRADLGADLAKSFQWKYRNRKRIMSKLRSLNPLDALGEVAWLHVYDASTVHLLFSKAAVTQIQGAAIRYVRDEAKQLPERGARGMYQRNVLQELDLMQDPGGIVRPVREKVERMLAFLTDEWTVALESLQQETERSRAELESQQQATEEVRAECESLQQTITADRAERRLLQQAITSARVELAATEEALLAQAGATVGSTTNWQHLARAARLLERHPDLTSKDAFLDVAMAAQDELGPRGEDPGNTIWRGVQRLGKEVLRVDTLPDHYLRFAGFRQLVFDLVSGAAAPQDSTGQAGHEEDSTGR